MDQQPSNLNNSFGSDNNAGPALIISSDTPKPPHRSHKKLLLFTGVIILVVCGAGGGFLLYQQAQQRAHDQAVRTAKLKADKQAAYLRQGTIQEVEASLEAEQKQETDEDTHLIFNASDSLQREAAAAEAAGGNNATSL